MTELDLVVLQESIVEHGLVAGDVGTVVHRYADGDLARQGCNAHILTLMIHLLEKGDIA